MTDLASKKEDLMSHFPNLTASNWEVTSPQDPLYNCIAWAANDKTQWWWPGVFYWPISVENETVECFVEAFSGLGYEVCDNGTLVFGIEKVAIYASDERKVKHMARQLPCGKWSSKCGKNFDISHTLSGLESKSYGSVVLFMERSTF